MTDVDAVKIETIECATIQDGSVVMLTVSGAGFRQRFTLPTTGLGIFIEQLLKMHNTARAHSVLGDKGEGKARKVQPVIETFLVDDLSIVVSEDGPVTVRITSRDGSRDIVFPPPQWAFLRSPSRSDDPADPVKLHH